jgi:hypothetical protein
MSEIQVQPPKSIPPKSCVKCGQKARLIRRMPVNPFGLEEKHTSNASIRAAGTRWKSTVAQPKRLRHVEFNHRPVRGSYR